MKSFTNINNGDNMINSYEIKMKNNEQVLYLYLDFNYEFADFNFRKQNEKFQNMIKKFIKDRKIAFTGTAVALIVGGILIGRVYLDKDVSNVKINESVIEELIPSENNLNIEENQLEEIINNVNANEQENVNEIDNSSKTIENKKEDVITETKDQIIEKQPEEQIIEHIEESTEQKQLEETSKIEQVEENKIYINVKRSDGSIINLELEEYVIGVVAAEMPASFNMEALKAQAVIARTYALKAISKGQTLTDNSNTQNYKNNNELQNMWGSSYNTYYNKILTAVDSTKGLYLSYNNDFIEAVYHSTSNGKTEAAINVWGNSFPYLISVDSPYDSLNANFEMEKTISYNELSLKLKMEINIDTEFNILVKTQGDRVGTIQVNDQIYSGVDFRNILGLRSADFDITKTEQGIIFTTRGYGHGVGMSQYGANGMAKNGYTYLQILNHYYPGTILNNI